MYFQNFVSRTFLDNLLLEKKSRRQFTFLCTPGHHGESSSGVCQPQLQPQPVSSATSTSCLQEGPTSTPFFHFLCCSCVSEWQTILGQWPWQTAAAALVPTGHTKLYSSQLVSLSLWLNAWWTLSNTTKGWF